MLHLIQREHIVQPHLAQPDVWLLVYLWMHTTRPYFRWCRWASSSIQEAPLFELVAPHVAVFDWSSSVSSAFVAVVITVGGLGEGWAGERSRFAAVGAPAAGSIMGSGQGRLGRHGTAGGVSSASSMS